MSQHKLVPFKVGVSRWTKGLGWTHEYGVFNLEPDSRLGDMPPSYLNDESVMSMFGLRYDQPEYDRVHDFHSLAAVMDK